MGCQNWVYNSRIGVMSIPLLKTARHSSLDLWSGYDIFSDVEADVLNRELRNGIDGIDFRIVGR